MQVCYFGTYHSSYPGNSVLIKGLRKNGVNVFECHYAVGERYRNKAVALNNNLKRFIYLTGYIKAYLILLFRYLFKTPEHKCVIIGYLGQIDIFLAKLLKAISKKPIIFNPMFSLYDTIVLDRKIYGIRSLPARIIRRLDMCACRFSDMIFIDAKEHVKIWTERIGCHEGKFRLLPFGADDEIFSPVRQKTKKSFNVLFYGTFMPSQGIPYIIRAAKLLEDEKITFTIIGYGQVSDEVQRLAKELNIKNIDFIKWVRFEKLPKYIQEADICLGMFGTSPKTRRCLANKVVQAIACAKPVITCDADAPKEFLTHRENVIFCEPGNPQSLVEAILLLKENPELREKIGNGGYQVFEERFSPEAVGSAAKDHLENLTTGGRK